MRTPFLVGCLIIACWPLVAVAGERPLGQQSDTNAPPTADAAKSSQKGIAKAKAAITEAGRKFQANKMEEAVKLVDQANLALQQALTHPDPKIQKLAEPVYGRLRQAHKTLTSAGQLLQPLPDWETMLAGPASTDSTGSAISFRRQIVPWMVKQCGKCHIDSQKGNFSLATYDELMKGSSAGRVIFAGESQSSRLVEVIANGDMPRGSGKVAEEDLQRLRQWIDEGARNDADKGNARIADWVTVSPEDEAKPATPSENKPMGPQTIRFARDLAPVLVEQCSGCHLQTRQFRGGLNMETFNLLVRGGDSGKAMIPGQPDTSLLIKKLRGTSGQRMPMGRPPLSEEIIAKFETWIREGAQRDDAGPDTPIKEVANQAWAANASAEERLAKQKEIALEQWKKAMPKEEPASLSDDTFLVVGNIGTKGLEDVLALAQLATKVVRKQLKIPADTPIARGPLTIYAFQQRYDYGEFGKMVEQRSLPTEWTGHWRKQVFHSYAAMVYDPKSSDVNRLQLVQQLASLAVGTYEGVPQWFADGVGRKVLVESAPKDDPRNKQWQNKLGVVAQQLQDAKQVLEGKLGEEQSALVGMMLANTMMEKGNRKAFDVLLKELRQGKTFPQAFEHAIGNLEKSLQKWINMARG